MREIVLDTETTGLDPGAGHRIVEIGCLGLINHVPSGETFQRYLNPERDMPSDAFDVHGLSDAFLADKPLFAEVADGFIAFIADSPLVIHNARFGIGFVNAELERVGRAGLDSARHRYRRARRRRRRARSQPPGKTWSNSRSWATSARESQRTRAFR